MATGASAKAPVRSDDEIRNSVLMELKWDPKVTSDDIGVAVKDGVVTLTGFVLRPSDRITHWLSDREARFVLVTSTEHRAPRSAGAAGLPL